LNSKVKSFFHTPTYTWTHLVTCQDKNIAVLIDPVLDYCANNANTSTQFTDNILDYIEVNHITLKYVLETHAHADHLTSADYIRQKMETQTLIGAGITSVQQTFKKIFNLDNNFQINGSQFNLLLKDKDTIKFGNCQMKVMHTPGHTNDSMSYIIGDNVFIGDTLFSPDYGTARCDFPGGDTEKLYDSIQAIYQLGEDKKLYLCHDYPPNDRQPQAWYGSKQQQQNNIHLRQGISKSEFVKMRNARDKKLNQPRLIIPSIQINIDAGRFPQPESNGIAYLKTPLNTLADK
jgi:glyoxylase-like metal-dependent hydrolase (beta-lactamase superfamily II)